MDFEATAMGFGSGSKQSRQELTHLSYIQKSSIDVRISAHLVACPSVQQASTVQEEYFPVHYPPKFKFFQLQPQ